jgi:hypothetical protein
MDILILQRFSHLHQKQLVLIPRRPKDLLPCHQGISYKYQYSIIPFKEFAYLRGRSLYLPDETDQRVAACHLWPIHQREPVKDQL